MEPPKPIHSNRLGRVTWGSVPNQSRIYLRTWFLGFDSTAWTLYLFAEGPEPEPSLEQMLERLRDFTLEAPLPQAERQITCVRAAVREFRSGFFNYGIDERIGEFEDLQKRPGAQETRYKIYDAELPLQQTIALLVEGEKIRIPAFSRPKPNSEVIFDMPTMGLSFPGIIPHLRLEWRYTPQGWEELAAWIHRLQKFLHQCVEAAHRPAKKPDKPPASRKRVRKQEP